MARNAGHELFVRCASGFEGTLAQELKALGIKRVRPLVGGVTFFGSLKDAYRACLWSRVATRVQLVLARVDVHDAESLYQGVYDFPWEEHVFPGSTLAVTAHGTNSALRNTQFTALKVKDAVCDRLRDRRGSRPDVNAKDPDFAIDISVHERRATVLLNLSGESLHRRGYRKPGEQTEAPLKETLAAGMLLAAGWQELAQRGATFSDPMCGSGTLPIEAALIAAGIAPGALRARWGFQGWLQHDEALWSEIRKEAELAGGAAAKGRLRIFGGDLDPKAIGIARENARRAGISSLVQFVVSDASKLETHLRKLGRGEVPSPGLLATNPPYGYRLQSAEQLPETYAALANAVSSLPEGWRVAVITPDPGVDTALGQTADQVIPCRNGALKTTLRLYDATPSGRNNLQVISLAGVTKRVSVAEPNSEQFAARLRKVARERAKWAKRSGISCYRVYDADLPDYALSVDLYEGVGPEDGQRFARITEHPAPASVDADRAARRLSDAAPIVAAVLDIDRLNLVILPAHEEKGAAKVSGATIIHTQESNLVFEVNLSARQDTGIPLDHRPTRQLVSSLAKGGRFLCLNAYAGAPTAYAAAGEASQTTTVDPSKPFLEWARRTLDANGFSGRKHRLEQAEVTPWLKDAASSGRTFDLVFVDLFALIDPSERPDMNSMQKSSTEHLGLVANVLAPGGSIILISSLRSVRLDYDMLRSYGLSAKDVTSQTIPHDFQRTPKIHRCWLLSKPS